MIITTTGYFNTGSSAITHLLKEFDDVSNVDDVYEVRLLYDPDCISDLEYNLIECPHRQNTSYAIKRFKKYIDYNSNPLINHHYEKICHGNFKKIAYEYIDQISLFKYQGLSHIDVYEKGYLFGIINRCYQKVVAELLSKGKTSCLRDSLISSKTEQYAGVFTEKDFLMATHRYIQKILNYCNPNQNDIIMVDQLVPPTNITRYLRYLPPTEEVKVFVVDRDPRDLFVTCKYFLKSHVIPFKVEDFCEWYKWTRAQSHIQKDPACVCRLNFEDLIYEYESTRRTIALFCGLDLNSCSKKLQIFRPEKSINNTQVWKRDKYPETEIGVIEEKLEKYCYDFESKKIQPDFNSGKMFNC